MFNLRMSPLEDVAIDIGTSNTLICDSKDVILNEPSVVATKGDGSGRWTLLSAGRDAKMMIGKAPGHIHLFRPIRDGVVADFEIAELMMKHSCNWSSGIISFGIRGSFLPRLLRLVRSRHELSRR